MHSYEIYAETVYGEQSRQVLFFQDDDAAVAYLLPVARGSLVELRHEGKLVATVDERPCLPRAVSA